MGLYKIADTTGFGLSPLSRCHRCRHLENVIKIHGSSVAKWRYGMAEGWHIKCDGAYVHLPEAVDVADRGQAPYKLAEQFMKANAGHLVPCQKASVTEALSQEQPSLFEEATPWPLLQRSQS